MTNAKQIYQAGVDFAQRGQYEQARESFERFIELQPENGEGYNDLGVVNFEMGNISEAVDCFQRAKELLGDTGQVCVNLARAYIADGKPGWATELFGSLHRQELLDTNMVVQAVEGFCKRADYSSAMELLIGAKKSMSQDEILAKAIADVRGRRPKIAFFCGGDGDTFLKDITKFTSERFEMRIFDGTTQEHMFEMMSWSDISWFEWCTELAVLASQMPKVSHNIVRLHRYEAYLNYPSNIDWTRFDTVITVGNKFVIDALKLQVPQIESMVDMVTMPNGVDMEKFTFVDRPHGKNIAFAATLRMVKNPMLLLQCMAALHKIDPEYKLFIAGHLSDLVITQYMEHIIPHLGLEGVVFHEGFQNDMNTWLADKHYIVTTSAIESQGMGVLEGMARGLKPLVHNFPGAEGTFTSDYLFNTPEKFCKLVTSQDYQPAKYRQLVEERYSLGMQLESVNALFEQFETAAIKAV